MAWAAQASDPAAKKVAVATTSRLFDAILIVHSSNLRSFGTNTAFASPSEQRVTVKSIHK
jgi:hypothetical protein